MDKQSQVFKRMIDTQTEILFEALTRRGHV